MRFNIVPIEEKHIEDFWSAVDSVARERKYLAFLEGPPIHTTINFVQNNINDGWPHFIALDEEEKIIGWCDITSLDRPIFNHVGTLGIGVLAQYRGQGVGEALIRRALQQATIKGLTRVELTVFENNKPAITLYEKVGFVVEGVHKNKSCIDGKYENHLFMALLYPVDLETITFQIIPQDSPEALDAVLLRKRIYYKLFDIDFVESPLPENHIQIVGLKNKKVISTAVLVPEGKHYKMQRVVVDEELTNTGIGSKMMVFCEEYAKKQGIKSIYCHARDAAVNFYLKNNYIPEGEYFTEDTMPHLKMRKLI